MKAWNRPEITELNISETAHNWFGNSRDGGYLGDGQISGHLEWKKPCVDDDNSQNPSQPLSQKENKSLKQFAQGSIFLIVLLV